jgi:FkbM family methyltransferase
MNLGQQFSGTHQFPPGAWEEYLKTDPYETRWITYPLGPESIVVDLGAWKGDWGSQIYCRYNCFVDMYEPQPDLARLICARFGTNYKFKIFNFALGNVSGAIQFYNGGQNGSIYKSAGGEVKDVLIKVASDVFNSQYPLGIDLLKINVEGAEYDILPDLIRHYDIKKVTNILIAFHSNVPGYKEKMEQIRKMLAHTHRKVWGVDEVFESWERLP